MAREAAADLCSHCLLPVRGASHEREVEGEAHRFCCYGCCLAFQVAHGQSEESEAVWLLIRFGVGMFLSMNIMMFSLLLYAGSIDASEPGLLLAVQLLLWALATPTLVILGGPFFVEAWQEARRGRLAASALIALGTGSAYAYSTLGVLAGSEQLYFDTLAMVLVLFTLGRWIEAAARARAVRSLAPILAAERHVVTVLVGDDERTCPAGAIEPGMLVLIRPGERIGVDGVVVEGRSQADEAAMTGESRPVDKAPGDPVLAGTINQAGRLTVRSIHAGRATRWAEICRAVRASLAAGHDLQRLAERAGGLFIPVVLAIAVGTIWWWQASLPMDHALLHGLAVLVVACPCALGLAAPLATSLGVARLAGQGCVVRGGAVLEALAALRAIALDKTGTLTSGKPRLIGIVADGASEDELLRLAGGLERDAAHPLGRGVMAALVARRLAPAPIAEVQVVPGCGVTGSADGRMVLVGSGRWLQALGLPLPAVLAAPAAAAEAAGQSVIAVAWNGVARGLLLLEDSLRPEARSTVLALAELRLAIGLLSGDARPAVERFAGALGIARFEAALSPEGKQAALQRWRRELGRIAMVGDGLNDGPVLAAADVGIAIGSGTDLARAAADLVLPPDGLDLLPWVIGLARAVRLAIVTNLVWAFGYNLIAVALAAAGLLQPVAAAAVMAGSSLVVVLNSLQIERRATPERATVTPASLRPHPA
jgi:Cu2+-exporting ATPase